jgi:hypothetical protein
VFVSRIWKVALDGEDHIVKLQAPNWFRGWPDAFHVDGRRYPIKLRLLNFARQFEFSFEIAGHPAALIMSKPPVSQVWWPRFKAALHDPAARVNASGRWSYELLIDGETVSAD